MADDDQSPDDEAEDEFFQERVRNLKIPRNALRDFMERLRPGRQCEFCKQGVYEAAPAPEGGTAGILSTPVPYIKGLGVWFYSATCNTCGDTRFFHANKVRKLMSEPH
ncbi:hypothetical protein [Pseudomonas monteilii]|uniref:hypothetical protein n=1 Tax=Pseudomonas monteilii TaxID=76759 RepID=UPI001E453BA2|nr:hypothetical protein [Pseudomonas monteilii]MCE1009311.1 hypothetical protein [Pseudomonas monteilii]